MFRIETWFALDHVRKVMSKWPFMVDVLDIMMDCDGKIAYVQLRDKAGASVPEISKLYQIDAKSHSDENGEHLYREITVEGIRFTTCTRIEKEGEMLHEANESRGTADDGHCGGDSAAGESGRSAGNVQERRAV